MASTTRWGRSVNRRDFLKTGVAAASGIVGAGAFPVAALAKTKSPNEKLNIALIGVGGKGMENLQGVSRENIVALCDVDWERAGPGFEMFPDAKRYKDYRIMLEKEDKNIDAVVITTPDHVHIPATVMAMEMGKHSYTEKPLGHNVHEIRVVTELAKKTGLATQLGTSAHSGQNYRGIVELVKAGTIGEVKEVHAWCDSEWDPVPRVPRDNFNWGDQMPKDTPPVPKDLDWNLWLGPAPVRPYHPAYHPISWRGWWDFGNGRLGDMGCHLFDLPFSALDLKYPLTIEAKGPGRISKQVAPPWLIGHWTFPARGSLPPVELTWYDGNKRPEKMKGLTLPNDNWPWFVMFVGSEGMLIAGMSTFKLYPEDKFAGVKLPELPPIHHAWEWIEACKAGNPTGTGTHFGYSGPLAETVLLGTVAYRVGKKLEWDPVNLKATNAPEAEQFIRHAEYRREGWRL